MHPQPQFPHLLRVSTGWSPLPFVQPPSIAANVVQAPPFGLSSHHRRHPTARRRPHALVGRIVWVSLSLLLFTFVVDQRHSMPIFHHCTSLALRPLSEMLLSAVNFCRCIVSSSIRYFWVSFVGFLENLSYPSTLDPIWLLPIGACHEMHVLSFYVYVFILKIEVLLKFSLRN